MEALGRRLPVDCTIVTAAPAQLFAESLTAPFTVHTLVGGHRPGAAGCHDRGSGRDLGGPGRVLPAGRSGPGRPGRRPAPRLRTGALRHRPAGHRGRGPGRYPSVLIENFTWDWILRRLPGPLPRPGPASTLWPGCSPGPTTTSRPPRPGAAACDLVVQPVARSVRDPEQVRRRLAPLPGQRLVLVTMGGVGGGVVSLAPLVKRKELLLPVHRSGPGEQVPPQPALPRQRRPRMVPSGPGGRGRPGGRQGRLLHRGRGLPRGPLVRLCAATGVPRVRHPGRLFDRHLDSWELGPEQLHNAAPGSRPCRRWRWDRRWSRTG